MRPLCFLDITSQKSRFSNHRRKATPCAHHPAGFSRVQVSARVFTPGRHRPQRIQHHKLDRRREGEYEASPLRIHHSAP